MSRPRLNQATKEEPRTNLRVRKRPGNSNDDFSKVGGLRHHLNTLKELIIFPLLHGNVFSYFKIKPVKGVIFHGPPGTGKTLVAGALAAELNKQGVGKVSFFERKGGDILDKWVGGSEKNLRTLFEKASKCRPAIIFFDELDGLAPIRSEKNDQVHCSVVATLLALMDGLDSKPGVVVIGATNRIDAVDPALRRSGRFDRELYFPLPGYDARQEIIQVHINAWKHKPSPKFISRLSDLTTGFCGADLQALCCEAVLCCLRRLYPQINSIEFVTKIEAESLKVEECDFMNARLNLLPCSLKQAHKVRDLSHIVRPLLLRQQNRILKYIEMLWPHFLQDQYKYRLGEKRYAGRILLVGNNMQGLNTHLIPAVLKHLEHIPVFVYDSAQFDAIKANFANIQMNHPAVIILSRIDEWWNYINDYEQHGIISALEDIHAGLPILTIASCKEDVPVTLHNFFYNNSTVLVRIGDPTIAEKESFFAPLFFDDKILSLYRIWEKEKKRTCKTSKCEVNNFYGECSSSRKRKYTTRSNGVWADDSAVFKNKKPKMAAQSRKVQKRIKKCEEEYGPFKSNSASDLFDLQKVMMSHIGDVSECRKIDSYFSLGAMKHKQYFTRVLSDLLNQRSSFLGNQARSTTILDLANVKDLYVENMKKELEVYRSISKKSMEDVAIKQIYILWKHTAIVTSKNLPVALLELLYDVISTCLSVYQQSFESVVKNLESVLTKIQNQYQSDSEVAFNSSTAKIL